MKEGKQQVPISHLMHSFIMPALLQGAQDYRHWVGFSNASKSEGKMLHANFNPFPLLPQS